MLEIKNLTKIYKTKGGTGVKALDNVSIRFGETGLVFLLGKSGSGKSTLLNVAGGLDEPTSGEVIVMGKSSKDFSGSDFDSYRNTYVGFVFQEYNVLNEFNVEDNVSLALELQGKTREKEKVKNILEEVELGSFAKRKPNTLSGGQKQRIAIARALVKDPQIIMADEPTGALDSATGKQVFDTLKRLSETRLVLVVSHDREFAEMYGDRIVELKDGKIISDVTKVKEAAEEVGNNLTKIGENVLTVKGGKADENTLRAIRKFLEESEGEVLLSKGETEIANFKRVNHIDETGAHERFEGTSEEGIKRYESDRTKFIRSRLPARKAIKIGASGLKLKPFRLVLTILLSFISFVMFGLFSTMMLYSGDDVLVQSFFDSDYEYLTAEKYYETLYIYDDYSYTSSSSTQFTPAEVKALGGENSFGAYAMSRSISNITFNRDKGDYYRAGLEMVASLPASHPLRGKLTGKYPVEANEIAVSTYLLEGAQNGTFLSVSDEGVTGAEIQIRSAQDIIGKNVGINGNVFKITGVFDSGEIPAKYDALKTSDNEANWLLKYTFEGYIREGLHSLAFVSDAFLEKHANEFGNGGNYVQYFDYCQNYLELYANETLEWQVGSTSEVRVWKPNLKPVLSITFFREQPASLTGNQVIVPCNIIDSVIQGANGYEYNEEVETVLRAFRIWQYQEQLWDEETDEWRYPTQEEIDAAEKLVLEYLSSHTFTPILCVDGLILPNCEIVGFYSMPENGYWQSGFYCSQELYDRAGVWSSSKTETKYEKEDDATYDYVFLTFSKNKNDLLHFVDQFGKTNEKDVYYSLKNVLYMSVQSVNDTVEELSLIFLIVGLVLAAFSALLLLNFITMSISNKKKEIGILRAVGARGTDVFKIFFSESGIIVGICTLLALIGTIVTTFVLNNLLKAEVGLDVTLFVFGPLPILLMIGVALFVAVLGTFLPVFFAARKKPVESIRAL